MESRVEGAPTQDVDEAAAADALNARGTSLSWLHEVSQLSTSASLPRLNTMRRRSVAASSGRIAMPSP